MTLPEIASLVAAASSTALLGAFVVGKYHSRFLHVEKTLLEKIDPAVDLISGGLLSLQGLLIGKKIIDNPFYKPGSALRLTEEGRQLLRDSGLQDVLDGDVTRLEARIHELAGTHGRKIARADIWEAAQRVVMLAYHDDSMTDVRNYLYDHPVSPTDAVLVGAIYLTDRILKQDYAHAQ